MSNSPLESAVIDGEAYVKLSSTSVGCIKLSDNPDSYENFQQEESPEDKLYNEAIDNIDFSKAGFEAIIARMNRKAGFRSVHWFENRIIAMPPKEFGNRPWVVIYDSLDGVEWIEGAPRMFYTWWHNPEGAMSLAKGRAK